MERLMKAANELYRQGNYRDALATYQKLIRDNQYFEKIVSLNIRLCEKNTSPAAPDIVNSWPVDYVVFNDHLSKDAWRGWHVSPNYIVQDAGWLRCKISGSQECALRSGIHVESDNFYKLDFKYRLRSKTARLYWIIRDSKTAGPVNFYNGNQAPVIMHGATTDSPKDVSLIFRSFCTTSDISLHLLVQYARENDDVQVDEVKLSQLKKEQFSTRPLLAKGEKIIASLASIPNRKVVLTDVVRSLYHQVDELRIFLNGYQTVPTLLLNDPKITFERSDIWGDNGDAGKMFWANDVTPGYRFICDDDIIYPVDYVQTMVRKLRKYNDEAIIGLHGILIKQPVHSYYAPNARHVTHLRNENVRDYSCHILGTGAIAYRAGSLSFSADDLHFKNMADIWFAKKAQEQQVPLVCISRPNNWVMPQPQTVEHSIFAHSINNENSSLNTASVQTSVVRDMYPVTIYPAKTHKPKVIFSIKTYNRQDYLEECIDSFLATRTCDYEWVVIIADDGSTDNSLEYMDKLVLPHELHIIKNQRRFAVGQCNSIFQLAEAIGFDFGFQVDDDVLFVKPGWDKLYLEAAGKSGFDHLCFLHQKHFLDMRKRDNKSFEMSKPVYDKSGLCEGYTHVEMCMGALFTFTSRMINAIGGADEKQFPIRGQWHIDLSMRASRAGFNKSDTFFDAVGSNECIILQNDKKDKAYKCSIPWSDEYKKTKDPIELERRYRVISDQARIYIPQPSAVKRSRLKTLNSFFDKVYVLNLDRRSDRWRRVASSAKHFGIELARFPAIDGKTSPYIERYQEYSQRDFVQVPDEYALNYNFELYRNYRCDMSRVAYLEKRNQRKAIGSPGAWGYLLTMIKILEHALENEYEQILVLDDDVMFHKNFNELFSRTLDQVPENWLILQLGSLQYDWNKKWIEWYSDNLYMCKGSSLGSHAVGMRRAVIPLVLNQCLRFDMPYDEGPLHKPKAKYPLRCLTVSPNLIIQDVEESDISDQTAQKVVMSKKDNVYRWDKGMYFTGDSND